MQSRTNVPSTTAGSLIRAKQWHSFSIDRIWREVASSPDGLSQDQVAARQIEHGANELSREKADPAWKLLLRQFKSPLMYLMILATAVSYSIGNVSDTIFIIVVLVSNALVGFYQEHKANKSLEMLRGLVRKKARVVRDGRDKEIDVKELVPGDIVIIRAGDKVPADGKIFELHDLKIDESSLTGESVPVNKSLNNSSPDAEVGDRPSMAYMGTLVEEGTAKMVVVATGARTEYGDIVAMLEETKEEPTPLQKTVKKLSIYVGAFISIIIICILIEGFLAGRSFAEIFAVALALFVSAIPEGLLPAITIVLTLGMHRIVRQKGLVRRLAATETLGSVTVICTDKTGTLTHGTMEVTALITSSGVEEIDSTKRDVSALGRNVLTNSLLSCDAFIENPEAAYNELVVRGRPTEQALLRAGYLHSIQKDMLDTEYVTLDKFLFTSEHKYSATVRRQSNGTTMLFAVGAPEKIIERIARIATDDGYADKGSEAYHAIMTQIEKHVSQGFRLVACAQKQLPSWSNTQDVANEVNDLDLVGCIVLSDPIRAEVPNAFRLTHRAGIRTMIVTGDHHLTALAIAKKIGFAIKDDQVLLGHQIETMSDAELVTATDTTLLFARVSPRHKFRIVRALQSRGEVVAMFGDGVNDAPALKAANIGVAVNVEVDAAREVADIVLLDSGFTTIVNAIEQGRIIFNNIRRVFLYLITQDFSQFFIFFIAIAIGAPLPLIAAQLLLVNLIESGLPDIALTTEVESEGIMSVPPRKQSDGMITRATPFWMFSSFITSGSIAFAVYYGMLSVMQDIALTRTVVTVLLSLESLFLAFSLRSFNRRIWRKSIFGNRWLTAAVFVSLCMVLAAVYIPSLQNLLSTVPLSLTHWAVILVANLCEIAIIDYFKIKYLSHRA